MSDYGAALGTALCCGAVAAKRMGDCLGVPGPNAFDVTHHPLLTQVDDLLLEDGTRPRGAPAVEWFDDQCQYQPETVVYIPTDGYRAIELAQNAKRVNLDLSPVE